MILRRIITVILFALFFLILELNSNSVWGWILLALLTAGFTVLFECGVMKSSIPLKATAWCAYFLLFAAVLFITYPPVKRVPAVKNGDPEATGIVEIRDGKVQGVVNDDRTVEIFAGIPYAAPPVGDLRFKEPQDPTPWEGVLKADSFAPMSMQPRNIPIYYSLADLIGYHDYKWFDLSDNYRPAISEDSLYVNVWRPKDAGKDLPVLVYIHGGSLQTGQPWYKDYSGENLAKEGVIVVNMGYRLGVFGYLALEELAAESENGTTGNYGMLDQIKALEWVRDNIAYFGGDPSNVTLAGESAGSAAVSALCTSPLSKGLFRRVIMESSTVASVKPPHSYRSFDDALASGRAFMEKYGVHTLDELRALPAEKIVDAAYSEHHMTVDGYALKEDPYLSYQKGAYHEEAVLHGFNAEESGPFIIFSRADLKNFESKIRAYFGKYTDEVLQYYPAATDAEADEYWAEIYGAVFFDYPHYAYDRLAVKNGIPHYEYIFTKHNGRLGCWHSGEQVYAYGNIPQDSKLYDEGDRALMSTFMRYFLNFIRTGDPNGEDLPLFPQNDDSLTYLELGDEVKTAHEKERKIGLFGILDRMQNE